MDFTVSWMQFPFVEKWLPNPCFSFLLTSSCFPFLCITRLFLFLVHAVSNLLVCLSIIGFCINVMKRCQLKLTSHSASSRKCTVKQKHIIHWSAFLLWIKCAQCSDALMLSLFKHILFVCSRKNRGLLCWQHSEAWWCDSAVGFCPPSAVWYAVSH